MLSMFEKGFCLTFRIIVIFFFLEKIHLYPFGDRTKKVYHPSLSLSHTTLLVVERKVQDARHMLTYEYVAQ